MSELRFSDSVFIDRPPEVVHDMVCDLTHMGECSASAALRDVAEAA